MEPRQTLRILGFRNSTGKHSPATHFCLALIQLQSANGPEKGPRGAQAQLHSERSAMEVA